jgi:uncharacterized 2Fe-2S/4Fe-4S cluster protein (DUF4445 family)
MAKQEPTGPVAKQDARVVFQPSGRRGTFPLGTPLLDAARALGVYVESVCGGRGICGRCQISVSEGAFAKEKLTSSADHLGPVTEAEARYASLRELKSDRRLSCQATIQGDMVVDVPTDAQTNRQIVRKRAEAVKLDADSAIRLATVAIAEPDMDLPLGDADRLLAALAAETGLSGLTLDTPLLARVQSVLRAGDWRVTAAIWQDGQAPPCVTALWPGEKRTVYGLAIDIGSTTIAAHLCDLSTAARVTSAGTSNPQIRFGEDLMSRVSYVHDEPGGAGPDSRPCARPSTRWSPRLVEDVGATRDDVLELPSSSAIRSCTTCFSASTRRSLAARPSRSPPPARCTPRRMTLDLELNPGARGLPASLHRRPCRGGCRRRHALRRPAREAEALTLLVDVGTNAEIVLGTRERLLAASSPTGPAFEGAEISCGQRAAPGAIERIRIDKDTLEPRFKVIGSTNGRTIRNLPKRRTGRRHRHLRLRHHRGGGGAVSRRHHHRGRASSTGGWPRKAPRIVQKGRTHSYVVASEGIELVITQTDIRAIQLAKAALYAGVKLLLDKLGNDRRSTASASPAPSAATSTPNTP